MIRFVSCLILVALVAPQLAHAQLSAGVARADVTPPLGGPMYGYGARGTNVSQGVHDALFAKAIVLTDQRQKLAIVTLDLGSVSTESVARIKAIVGQRTDIEHVLLVASHTHSGPRATPDFPSAASSWIRDAEEKIAQAVIEADERMVSVRVGVGWGEVREGHNRRLIRADGAAEMLWENRDRIPTSPVDYQLGVMRVEQLDGQPLATLVSFQCHPVVLGPENLDISADYPGAFMRMVEAELGGQAMFLQGAAGDINPFWDKTPLDEGAFDQVEAMGRAVADEVIRVSESITRLEAAPAVSFQTEVIRLASRSDVERIERDMSAEINTVLIGTDIALATFPGEFFVEHGLALKARSQFEHTFFVGYTNGALGYFPTIQATTEGGYGAASSTRVEVGAGERLVDRALINLYYLADKISR
ncbi:MAG: neutral/alkaline non-lysosomal ceramidase N-terminal domain-containing protein [Gemmatimonadota bacterium]|nr:neutral/alkaline non-lysosomal ceramidase N-terminal domain-containing protein [Gemmatimonadota bacterium]